MSKSVASQLLPLFGVDPGQVQHLDFGNGWDCKSILRSDTAKPPVPVILIKSGPKNIAEVRKMIKHDGCVVLIESGKPSLLLRSMNESYAVVIDGDGELDRVKSILRRHSVDEAKSILVFEAKLLKVIVALQTATEYFDNRGVFSNHYLRNRIWDDIKFAQRNMEQEVEAVRAVLGSTKDMLAALGWKADIKDRVYKKLDASIVVTNQSELGIRIGDDVAPSYRAIAALKNNTWVILTNGRIWRLYTNKISTSTTNYFEINADSKDDAILRYLVVIFGAASYAGKNPQISIFFEQAREKSKKLENDLQIKILRPNGLFLDIVKGLLDHDGKTKFGADDLETAKESALAVMYRIWFILYAESRNLLPVRDQKYAPISLRTLWRDLDKYEAEPDGDECWAHLLGLFEKIRNGSPQHNLPQYNGGLFKSKSGLDGITVRNHFIAAALRELFETDGEPVDYGSLSVRHLGNIYESLLEFSIRQADKDILLVKDSGGRVREVESKAEATYSYKKYDLYLALWGGSDRKTTAAFYTPDEIVEFLVRQGLEKILSERASKIAADLKRYEGERSQKNLDRCMDRILDLQILDPAMGSGHFLVEALNQITQWATEMLKEYPNHPLLDQLEEDRKTVLNEQEKKGITIDKYLLTHDVVLKRRIMKRCVFGVDLNPLAVELAKLSLWLDSFAIGMPLTYLNHHIRHGDSTIGSRLNELENPVSSSLDDHFENTEKSSDLLDEIDNNSDITINQVRNSKMRYAEYEKQIRVRKTILDALTAMKMDDNVIEKNAKKNIFGYFKLIGDAVSGKIKNPDNGLKLAMKKIERLSKKYSFFHWELEMMDAFTGKRNGFDLVIGNPPWDKIRPNKNEFFTAIDPAYKKKSADEQKKIEARHNIEYQKYQTKMSEKRRFYKKHGGIGDNTDYEIYRIIMERAIQNLAPHGALSMIMPSAITSSRGATAIRKYLLEKDILSLYIFENRKKIFPIHSSYRFALLSIRNQKGSESFPAGFYLQNLKSLVDNTLEKDNFTIIYRQDIQKFSPHLSLIYEVPDAYSFKIIKKIFEYHPRLEDVRDWTVELGEEMNIAKRRERKFLVKPQKGNHKIWPVMESKNFHQHISKFSQPSHYADTKLALKRTENIKKFYGKNKEIHENPRLAYRTISASTNTRTMIASIIPHSVFTTLGAFMAVPRRGTFEIDPNYHRLNAYLCGIFNSTTYDHTIRPIIDKNVETYHIYNTPIPCDFANGAGTKIAKFSAQLALSESWHQDMADVFDISQKDVQSITLKERISITAKIDALAAIQYNLTRNEYKHVLEHFKSDERLFSDEELNNTVNYENMAKPDRDKHMRIFYNKVYKLAIPYFDEFSKGIGNNGQQN